MSDIERADVPNEWMRGIRSGVEQIIRERGINAGASHVEAVPPTTLGSENAILYIYDRSGSGKEWHVPVKLPADANHDMDAEALRIADALAILLAAKAPAAPDSPT